MPSKQKADVKQEKEAYKIEVVVDPDDPNAGKDEELENIPTDWSVKDRVAKEVSECT